MVAGEDEGLAYRFLNDQPTNEDEIGTHSKIAESLLRIIHSNLKRPFVVGLFGPWGVGKSSIVEMLKAKAKQYKDDAKVVVVDAWREHKGTFLREFVKKLARELLSEEQAEKVAEETDIKRIRSRSRWEPGWQATLWFYIFVAVVVALAGILLLSYFVGVKSEFPADKIAIICLTALIAIYFQFILPKYSVSTHSSEEDVTLHDVTHFRKICFEDIVDKCEGKTVCIVIDNLDRMGSDDAVAIMQEIKTFIVDVEETGLGGESRDAIPRKMLNKVVFIVPCDGRALREQAVKRGSEKDGNEFLRKFFNVSLRIPKFNDRDCYGYACSLLDQTNLALDETQKDRIAHIITSLFGSNPRQPKIFINNLLARYIVGEAFEKEEKLSKGIMTEHPEWLGVYVALESEFSELEMPKTVDGLRSLLLKGDSASDSTNKLRKEQRMAFLHKVESIVEQITPKAWGGYYYLKEANDALLIDGFAELEEAALKGMDDFVDKLNDVRAKNANVIELLWNVGMGEEAQIKITQSILRAKEKMVELNIKGRVSEEMGKVIHHRIHDLPALPAMTVYREILRPRQAVLHQILYDIETQDPGNSEPQLYADGGRKEFQVKLIIEILSDDAPPSGIEERLSKTLDFLAKRSDALTIPTVDCGRYRSETIMEKGIKLFGEGSEELSPLRLVNYCEKFAGNEYIKHLRRIVEFLNRNLNASRYGTEELSKAASKVKKLIDRENVDAAKLVDVGALNIISGLEKRYGMDDAWRSRCAILKTLKEYAEFKCFPHWARDARSTLINLGKGFLRSAEESDLIGFLKDERKWVGDYFDEVLPSTARRSGKLCEVVLDFYPDSTRRVIDTVCRNQPEWILRWTKKRGQRLGKRRGEVQSALLRVGPIINHAIEIYEALSFLEVTQLENARQQRENHFTNLLNSQQPLTSEEKLEFVLERILVANYTPNKEQRTKVDDAVSKMDQSLLGNKVKGLVREFNKLKKKRRG